MTPDHIRQLLGGYATGTLTDQEKKLLFEAALEDQELFDAMAAEDSLRELLEDSESRGYLLEALEEGPRSGSVPLVVNPPAPSPVTRARAQKMDMAKAEFAEGASAAPRPATPPAGKPAVAPVVAAAAARGNWMRYGAMAASAVVLFGLGAWGVKQLGRSGGVEVASVPSPKSEAPAPPSGAAVVPEADRQLAQPKKPEENRARAISSSDKVPGGGLSASAPSPLDRDEEKSKDDARRDAPVESAAAQAGPAAPPPAPVRIEERKAEGAARQQTEINASAPEIPPASQNMDAVVGQQQPQQRNANMQQQIASMTPDGARPGDASALYFQQQNTSNAQQRASSRLSDQMGLIGGGRAGEQTAERAKRRSAEPAAPASSAPGAVRPPAMKESVTTGVEAPGVRYQLQRKDEQGRWNVVSAAAGFKVGDEIALRVEQNVPGDVRVIYQDQSLKPVALALLSDSGAKRTAPFKLAAPGIAQFTIVLRGPATGTAIPAAPPSSQVAEAEGATNYVVRPNAPANAPVVAQISLTVR